MQKTFSFLGAVLALGFLATGCAGPEKKLGRGLNNTFEIVRWGDMRRSIEQDVLTNPDARYTTGMVKGFNRSMARVGIGIYEVVTFPIPLFTYDPVATGYIKPNPVYPDSYKPRIVADSTFATDTSIGFSGGDVAPWFPGSRFRIFEN
jgi:putative exosortase-associated protein (TIGR04073 family)